MFGEKRCGRDENKGKGEFQKLKQTMSWKVSFRFVFFFFSLHARDISISILCHQQRSFERPNKNFLACSRDANGRYSCILFQTDRNPISARFRPAEFLPTIRGRWKFSSFAYARGYTPFVIFPIRSSRTRIDMNFHPAREEFLIPIIIPKLIRPGIKFFKRNGKEIVDRNRVFIEK